MMEDDRSIFGPESVFALRDADIALESFPDETIAVNLASGRYFSIDLIGAEILTALTCGNPLDAVVDHLAKRYSAAPDDIDSAVSAFAARLIDEGLIRVVAVPAARAPFPDFPPPAGRFVAPTIAVYSDMEDLLLLDPIHDVDETGWPVRADAAAPDPSGPVDPE